MYSEIPMARKNAPNVAKMIIVEPNDGTGLHEGMICYLNLSFESFSNLAVIFNLSASFISVILLLLF